MMETKVWPGIAMPKRISRKYAIASMSFELIKFKHKESKETVSRLQNGSLLVMKDETQSHWLHRLPPTKLVVSRE
jgi:alkylated DNA repair dioxygenase AlkB